jgi:CRISPR-associated protein Cas5t
MRLLMSFVEVEFVFLHLQAPFAAFRPFQSGSYRSTTPVPSPSVLYGLLLNLAAIEQRDRLEAPVTKIRTDLPQICLAIGLLNTPSSMELALLSQQLHGYPVGSSGKELATKTYGSKFWIAPVTREVLVDLNIVVGVQTESWLEQRILDGLAGNLDEERYGLPFAGDNNFLFDVIESIAPPSLARWYEPLGQSSTPKREVCRLTTWIDRADNSKTQIEVFAPGDFVREPSQHAWLTLPPET